MGMKEERYLFLFLSFLVMRPGMLLLMKKERKNWS